MNFSSSLPSQAVLREFADAQLGDQRRTSRLLELVVDFARFPARSLPKQLRCVAKREAAYRFFGNPAIKASALIAPHVDQTRRRAVDAGIVRVVHDTCRFAFSGDRDGLEILSNEVRGFFGHFALAVGATEEREPLGVLGLRAFVNDAEGMETRRKLSKTEIDAHWRSTPRKQKARHRWESLACEVGAALPPGVQAVHVMDQEADDFMVYDALLEAGVPFVIRGSPRRLTEEGPLRHVLEAQPQEAFRDVFLSRRQKSTRKSRNNIARDERQARLSIRFAPVSIPRSPNAAEAKRDQVAMNVVHVFESQPPPDEVPIEWLLFTSEPVATFDDALKIVDHYRARWLIEEYFKALKTGCSFEKRQLTSRDGLERLLAVFVPIAWQLLRMRYLSRRPKPPPASVVMRPDQVELLRAVLRVEGCDYELPAAPTARDVLFGIAALGGHIRNNGDPGWLVIGQGYEDFLAAERGWRAAHQKM